MATARIALASVLSTVSNTAESVSSLINVTTKGVGMLDAIVTKASTEQKLRHRAGSHLFVKNLIRESAEAEATANIQVLEFCAKSDAHKAQFQASYDEFSKLFASELGTETPA